MPRCDFKWRAPFVLPDPTNHKIEMRDQVCELEKGHEGPHKSSTKVITTNTEKKES